MVVWKSCKRNDVWYTRTTSNDREGINVPMQPPPLPSSTQAILRTCCFLKLLLFCLFPPSPILLFNCIFFYIKIKYLFKSLQLRAKFHVLLQIFFPSSVSFLKVPVPPTQVSMPSLLLSSYADNKGALPSPVPLSCTKPTYRLYSDFHIQWPYFPLLLTIAIVVNYGFSNTRLFQNKQLTACFWMLHLGLETR